MEIKLTNGRSIRVDGFEFGYTYGGLLEGRPNETINKRIFERIVYPSSWGHRKVLRLEPDRKEFREFLKPAHYSVWLHSNTPIDPDYHGSELVVIWLDDVPNDRAISDIIQSGVQHIDWDRHAEDFEY